MKLCVPPSDAAALKCLVAAHAGKVAVERVPAGKGEVRHCKCPQIFSSLFVISLRRFFLRHPPTRPPPCCRLARLPSSQFRTHIRKLIGNPETKEYALRTPMSTGP